MAAKLFDRCKFSVSGAPGTGTITVGSAITGYRTPASAGGASGDSSWWVAEDGGAWQVFTGTLGASAGTLTVDSVIASSTGSQISLTSSAVVYCSAAASAISLGIQRAAAVNSTSGTSIDFTGIPSTAKRVVVILNGVSASGSGQLLIRLGTSGGVVTSGYACGVYTNGAAASSTAGFITWSAGGATQADSGILTLVNISGNIWVASGAFADTTFNTAGVVGGNVTLSAVLDRIRITTTNGTDTFDAGSVTIMWE